MLTVAQERLQELAREHGKEVSIHLYGQEVNPETYAITKADLLLQGEGGEAENMAYGSTLSQDGFRTQQFDFMLSNPPYGKSWKADLERMGGKDGIKDSRFVITHGGDAEFSLLPRSSDGQLLFLANKLSKMKEGTPLGSRIAEVHNGSSLFTGDAGQGESNIRRWILENDWLEAIIALPLNMFYNTGIATYIWVLTNRKPANRRGKVQLIDATMVRSRCARTSARRTASFPKPTWQRVIDAFLNFEESEQSKIFPNEAFGYWKIVIERPLRLKVEFSKDRVAHFGAACAESKESPLANLLERVAAQVGIGPHIDFNLFSETVESAADQDGVKLTPRRWKLIQTALAVKDEAAEPVIKKLHRPGKANADPLNGRYAVTVKGKVCVAEYEPDSDLRDTEQVPLLEEGGIVAFVKREVLPHVPDAWVAEDATKIGYEISFTRYFYKPQPLRTLEEIRADIEAIERETEGLLDQVLISKG